MKSVFQSGRCEFVFADENKTWLEKLQARIPQRPNHIWMMSSGTRRANSVQVVVHRKEGLLAAAEAANKHLEATSRDLWLNVLPTYHVGGLAIHARALLVGAKVVEPKWTSWNPKEFVASIERNRASLTSLVPTQVFDLVKTNLPSPRGLRAVVVGGGALPAPLYKRARQLGWPVLPSYGLTECGSQVATASLASLRETEYPLFRPLCHVELRLKSGLLQIRSEAICEWVSTLDTEDSFTLENPAPSGWLTTEDCVDIFPTGLRMIARRGDLVKILGVLVNVSDVEMRIQEWAGKNKLSGTVAILATPDERREHQLILVTDSQKSLSKWQRFRDEINSRLPGPERIQQFYWTPKIPMTDLQKIKREELRKILGL